MYRSRDQIDLLKIKLALLSLSIYTQSNAHAEMINVFEMLPTSEVERIPPYKPQQLLAEQLSLIEASEFEQYNTHNGKTIGLGAIAIGLYDPFYTKHELYCVEDECDKAIHYTYPEGFELGEDYFPPSSAKTLLGLLAEPCSLRATNETVSINALSNNISTTCGYYILLNEFNISSNLTTCIEEVFKKQGWIGNYKYCPNEKYLNSLSKLSRLFAWISFGAAILGNVLVTAPKLLKIPKCRNFLESKCGPTSTTHLNFVAHIFATICFCFSGFYICSYNLSALGNSFPEPLSENGYEWQYHLTGEGGDVTIGFLSVLFISPAVINLILYACVLYSSNDIRNCYIKTILILNDIMAFFVSALNAGRLTYLTMETVDEILGHSYPAFFFAASIGTGILTLIQQLKHANFGDSLIGLRGQTSCWDSLEKKGEICQLSSKLLLFIKSMQYGVILDQFLRTFSSASFAKDPNFGYRGMSFGLFSATAFFGNIASLKNELYEIGQEYVLSIFENWAFFYTAYIASLSRWQSISYLVDYTMDNAPYQFAGAFSFASTFFLFLWLPSNNLNAHLRQLINDSDHDIIIERDLEELEKNLKVKLSKNSDYEYRFDGASFIHKFVADILESIKGDYHYQPLISKKLKKDAALKRMATLDIDKLTQLLQESLYSTFFWPAHHNHEHRKIHYLKSIPIKILNDQKSHNAPLTLPPKLFKKIMGALPNNKNYIFEKATPDEENNPHMTLIISCQPERTVESQQYYFFFKSPPGTKQIRMQHNLSREENDDVLALFNNKNIHYFRQKEFPGTDQLWQKYRRKNCLEIKGLVNYKSDQQSYDNAHIGWIEFILQCIFFIAIIIPGIIMHKAEININTCIDTIDLPTVNCSSQCLYPESNPADASDYGSAWLSILCYFIVLITYIKEMPTISPSNCCYSSCYDTCNKNVKKFSFFQAAPLLILGIASNCIGSNALSWRDQLSINSLNCSAASPFSTTRQELQNAGWMSHAFGFSLYLFCVWFIGHGVYQYYQTKRDTTDQPPQFLSKVTTFGASKDHDNMGSSSTYGTAGPGIL